jgi:hypothetical protein
MTRECLYPFGFFLFNVLLLLTVRMVIGVCILFDVIFCCRISLVSFVVDDSVFSWLTVGNLEEALDGRW